MSWLTDTKRYRSLGGILGAIIGGLVGWYFTPALIEAAQTSSAIQVIGIVVLGIAGAEIGRLFHSSEGAE